jgi:hypothetical protein
MLCPAPKCAVVDNLFIHYWESIVVVTSRRIQNSHLTRFSALFRNCYSGSFIGGALFARTRGRWSYSYAPGKCDADAGGKCDADAYSYAPGKCDADAYSYAPGKCDADAYSYAYGYSYAYAGGKYDAYAGGKCDADRQSNRKRR